MRSDDEPIKYSPRRKSDDGLEDPLVKSVGIFLLLVGLVVIVLIVLGLYGFVRWIWSLA